MISDYVKEVIAKFCIGDRVNIIGGPFRDLQGVVKSVSSVGVVKIDVELFGNIVPGIDFWPYTESGYCVDLLEKREGCAT